MLRTTTLICLLLISVSGEIKAQQKFTLQQCIDYALEHNIPVRQAQLNSELAKSRLTRSYASFLPDINGSIGHNYSYGRTVDPFTNNFIDQRTQSNNFSLNSSVILFNGFQLQNTRRQSDYELQAGKKDVEKAKNDLSLSIVTLYMQLLFSQDRLEIARANTDAMEKQLGRTKQLVEAGALPKGNQLDMESQLASEKLLEVNAENQLDLARLDLAQAMEFDSSWKSLDIVRPELGNYQYTFLDLDPEGIFNIALQTQPEISSSELKVRAAGAGLAAARGTRSPQLFLNGSIGTGYSDARMEQVGTEPADSVLFGYVSGFPIYVTPPEGNPVFAKTPFNKQLDQNLNRFIGISLNIPIFNGLQAKTSIDQAKINFRNAELERQQTRNRLHKNIQQAHADAEAALKKFDAAARSHAAMKESMRYTQQKFDLGVLNSVDYLTVKNNLLRAESEMLQAQYEYVFKTKVLDFYMGKPVSF